MRWIPERYYKDTYREGTDELIPAAEFPFWEKRAREKMGPPHLKPQQVPDYLSNCICKIAELLYIRHHISGIFALHRVSSCSPDSYRSPFEGYANLTDEEFDKVIRGVVIKSLAKTQFHNMFVYKGKR